MIRLAASLVVAALVASAVSSAEPPRAESLDLLFIEGEQPARLELRVAIDGQPVAAIWDATFAQLLAFHDRDGDGSLSKAEAGRVPSAFALRQILWGQFAPFAGDAPPFATLDSDGDGRATGAELADFYRRAGLGGVLVGVGKPTATYRLTDALLKALDANRNGAVDAGEWAKAAGALRKFDANDDELIGPCELVEKASYPGAQGSILLASPFPEAKPDAVADSLPFLVFPGNMADRHWIAAVTERWKMRPSLPANALADIRAAAPAAAWNIRFGTLGKTDAPIESSGAKPPANERLTISSGTTRFELRRDDGKLKDQTAASRKRFAGLRAECDANGDGALDAGELGATAAAPLKQLVAVADRNADGTLDGPEVAAWLDLQEQIAKGHALLTVLDHGTGIYELLDADRDGSLSARELRAAWDRLKAVGCTDGTAFVRAKLPRQLVATISRGHPQTALGKPVRNAPDWFLAMDRNGDGDVSRKEFTGNAETFDWLDRDRDGLIDADESRRADAKK